MGREVVNKDLALIGCGAMAEQFHLPALAAVPEVRRRLVLVDTNRDRAEALAASFGIDRVATDLAELVDGLAGAVVAVPASAHYAVARACVEQGVSVLCEKPLCERHSEAADLVALGEKTGAHIAVNQTRRLYPSFRRVRDMIADGTLGTIQQIDWEEGEPFGWPCASGSFFGTAAGGRGVVTDKGAHVLDLLCWWLGKDVGVTGYADDSLGGTEAVAELSFAGRTCHGRVKMSWFTKLRNTFRVIGERGSVEGRIYDWNLLHSTASNGARRTIKLRDAWSDGDFAKPLIANFIAVVDGKADPIVPGASVLPSLAMIDECYARRTRFDMPWQDRSAEVVAHV